MCFQPGLAGADFGGEGDGIGYHLLHLLFQNTLDLFHFAFRRFHDQFIVSRRRCQTCTMASLMISAAVP